MTRTRHLPSISACLLLCAISHNVAAQKDNIDDIDSTAYAYPVVITPTRLRQSLADVPASVTIITGETLRRYGINNVPDALRLVPGMAVTKTSGNEFRISYHGTSVVTPRRLNVLIDGVSAYRPALSRVEWSMLPVAMEDIDRIEVTRGPDSASYGPNSMMAVINILTKRPKDIDRAMASVEVGSHYSNESTIRLGNKLGDHTHIAATANLTRNSGYDSATLPGGAHDSISVKRLNLRSQTDLKTDETLELQASLTSAKREYNYTPDPFVLSYPDQAHDEVQFSAKWTKALSGNHELQVRAYYSGLDVKQDWHSCWPRLALHPDVIAVLNKYPEFALAIAKGLDLSTVTLHKTPSQAEINQVLAAVASMGGLGPALARDACGTVSLDDAENRGQIELQDTYVLSDSLRVVSGVGLRYQDSYSEGYFSGKVNNQVRWIFGHMEYRPTNSMSFNLGGYGESNSLGPGTFAPRAAVNYHLSENQSVRAVYSKGTRTPDLVESRGRMAPSIEGVDPPVMGMTKIAPLVLLQGNSELRPERVASIELGHLIALRQWGATIDTRLFSERLTNLISDYNANFDIYATNNGSVKLDGIETQANWDLGSEWSGWLNYSYLLNHEATNAVEQTQWSRQSGSTGISRLFNNRWRASLSHYFSSGNGAYERLYERSDITLSHDFSLDTLPATGMLVISYLHTPTVNTYLSSIGYFSHSYNSRLSVNGKVRVAF